MIIFRTYLRLIQKYAPIIVSYLAIFVVLAFIIGGGRETEDQDYMKVLRLILPSL